MAQPLPPAEAHAGGAAMLLATGRGPVRLSVRDIDRPRSPAVTTEVREVRLVQRLRVAKGQLAVAERGDDERRSVRVDARQLLLGAVEVADRAAVVVLVMRGDHALRQAVEGTWTERQRHERATASEGDGNGHGRTS